HVRKDTRLRSRVHPVFLFAQLETLPDRCGTWPGQRSQGGVRTYDLARRLDESQSPEPPAESLHRLRRRHARSLGETGIDVCRRRFADRTAIGTDPEQAITNEV